MHGLYNEKTMIFTIDLLSMLKHAAILMEKSAKNKIIKLPF